MKAAGAQIIGALFRAALLSVCLLHSAACISADEDETPPPAKPSRGAVKLQFLPPPMDGTFSLGIYDAKGKLVRTLQREAKPGAFTAALDGFITSWDGKDDSGATVPAGRYSAHGFCVGDNVQSKRAEFFVTYRITDEKPSPQPAPSADPSQPAISPAPSIAADASPAADGSPLPSAPAVSPGNGMVPSDTIESVKDKLKTPDGKPFAPEEKVKLKLRLNPLTQEKSASAEVAVGFDEKGSFVKLADGLELKRVSETPHLKWVAAMRGSEAGSLLIFQSDGAAVEEFTVSKLGNMMAFDCGDFDYEPAK